MPLWTIYHPPTTFTTPDTRASLAADITKIYTSIGLPAFYVIVNFIPLPPSQTYIGGVVSTSPRSSSKPASNSVSTSESNTDSPPPPRPFIRFVITQVAVRLPDIDEAYAQNTAAIDAAINPHVKEQGYDWEYHVEETERRLWKINGMKPPEHKSEEEKVWAEKNEAVLWEGA